MQRLILRGSGRRRRRRARSCLRRGRIDVPPVDSRWAQTHFANQQNGFGIRFRRRFRRISAKSEWRHQDGIYGSAGGCRRRSGVLGFLALGRQGTGECANTGGRRSLRRRNGLGSAHAGARIVARTGGRIRVQRLNLPANQAHVAPLRDDHALLGKLRLDAHGSPRGEHAHFAILLQAQGHVAPPSGNSNRRGDNGRRVDRKCVRRVQGRMNAAIIQRQSQRAGRLDHFEMGRATDADFAACVQHEQSVPGTHCNITAAGDHCRRGVRFESGGSCRCHFEIIAFDSADGSWKILRGNVDASKQDYRQNRKDCDRGNPGRNSQPPFRDRLRKHFDQQLPEG